MPLDPRQQLVQMLMQASMRGNQPAMPQTAAPRTPGPPGWMQPGPPAITGDDIMRLLQRTPDVPLPSSPLPPLPSAPLGPPPSAPPGSIPGGGFGGGTDIERERLLPRRYGPGQLV